MENQKGCAPLTKRGSVVHYQASSPHNDHINVLDAGRTVNDFIDNRIKELGSDDNEEPFFVLSLDSLYMRHLRWVTNLPRVKPFYAVKCNSTPAVLKMLRALGTGFDCASKGEINLALSLGVTPDNIIYAHTTKPKSHIKYACSHGVDMMTFDNEDELMKVCLYHPKAKLVLRLAVDDSKSVLKLNSKFGAGLEAVGKLLERAKELDLDVIWVSFHTGGICTDSLAFKQAIADARHAFDIANVLGFKMNLLDIGGGYCGTDCYQVKFEECSEAINAALDEYFPSDCEVTVIAEPGRYFVESAFTLAMNIFAKRVVMDDQSDGEENTPNSRMMYYMSDGVFGSLTCVTYDLCKFELRLHRAVESRERRYRTTLWGPTCTTLDKLSDAYRLPELNIGEWLLSDNMGAYTVALSTDFNGFDRTCIYTVVTAETWHNLNLSHIYGITRE